MLVTWFLGTQTGPAVADVVFGDYNPSGKLPVSFPSDSGQQPLFYNTPRTGRPQRDMPRTFKAGCGAADLAKTCRTSQSLWLHG